MMTVIQKFKFIAIGLCVGIIAGVVVSSLIKPKADPLAKIESKTISGAPLVIGKITNQGHTTTIDANYSGKGESQITIPDDAIPSARAWNHYRYGIGASISSNLTYSLLFSYRYERVMGVGSIWCKNANGYEFGASVGAMYLFSLGK